MLKLLQKIAAKEETVAEAVSEYVERAVENADVENYTLADVVTEVQVEVFIERPSRCYNRYRFRKYHYI